jgi:hypothetical protein
LPRKYAAGAGLAAALVLTGCATHQRPTWARFGNTSTAEGGPAYHRDPHHQYFDRQHNRFYYYDPDKKQFFWENGQPKG